MKGGCSPRHQIKTSNGKSAGSEWELVMFVVPIINVSIENQRFAECNPTNYKTQHHPIYVQNIHSAHYTMSQVLTAQGHFGLELVKCPGGY